MSNLLNALVPALGWSLLHFVWQGLLIGWAASLAFQLLRNARPQARYAVACAALLLCAALPLAGIATRLAQDTPVLGASLLPPPDRPATRPSAADAASAASAAAPGASH